MAEVGESGCGAGSSEFLGERRHPSGSLSLSFASGLFDWIVRSCFRCCEFLCNADNSPIGL